VTAADVGDLDAALELVDDTIERRQPARDEVGVVAGTEESFTAVEYVVAVLVPADAGAAERRLRDPG
jgi:hypothetical protein